MRCTLEQSHMQSHSPVESQPELNQSHSANNAGKSRKTAYLPTAQVLPKQSRVDKVDGSLLTSSSDSAQFETIILGARSDLPERRNLWIEVDRSQVKKLI